MKKSLAIIAAVLAAILLGGYLFLRAKLDPEALGQMVIERVNDQEGMSLQADRFEIGVFKGFVLEGATLQATTETGTMSAQLQRLVLDYQLWPILSGELIVDRVLVESPKLEIVTTAAPTQPPADDSAGAPEETADPPVTPGETDEAKTGFAPTVSIGEFRVTDASLTARTEGNESPDLTILGLELELNEFLFDTAAADPILAIRGNGAVRLAQITAGDLKLEGGRGDLVLAEGVAEITALGITSTTIDMEVERLRADLGDETLPYELNAQGSVDLDTLLEAEGDGSFGRPSLDLTLQGQGPDPETILGEGTLTVPDGTLPSIAMLDLIERLLGGPSISGESYSGTAIDFQLSNGSIEIQPFELGLENLRLGAAGSADLDGPLDMVAVTRLPRDAVHSSVLDPFIDGLTDEEGWTTVPFLISGTLEAPEVDIDLTAVKETAIDMGKNAIEDAVGGLINKQMGKLRKKRNN